MYDTKLTLFLDAQASVFKRVLKELKAGRKETHWMWFVFPQLAGLGSSMMAQRFAIDSLDEAAAYLQHPVLGPRLLECTRLVLNTRGTDITAILGYPDGLKFRSCMTLFAQCAPEELLFRAALGHFFGGREDECTLELLATDARKHSREE